MERALPEVPGVEPGDTVVYDGVREVADRLEVDTALLHLGGVRFPVTGPIHHTMTAQAIERELANAPDDVRQMIRWLPIGLPTELSD